MTTHPGQQLPAGISEAAFQQVVIDYCSFRGLLVFHDNDSRRNRAGFPDLVIVGSRGYLFAELKTQTGRVRPDQQTWMDRLDDAGAPVRLWRPSDWPVIRMILDGIR